MLAPHMKFTSYSSLVPVQSVSGVIRKDCTEVECLYPSQCGYLSSDTDLQSYEGTGALVSSLHVTNPYPSELIPMNNCCHS